MARSGLRSARRAGLARVLTVVVVLAMGGSAVGAEALISMQTGFPLQTGSGSAYQSQISSSSTVSVTSNTTSPVLVEGLTEANASECISNVTGVYDATVLNSTRGSVLRISPLNYAAAQLFENFSRMSIVTTTSVQGSSHNVTVDSSYAVVGRPVIGSVGYYEVNFTMSADGLSEAATVLFAPNGTATRVTSGTLGSSVGSAAAAEGRGMVSPFLFEMETSPYAESLPSSPYARVLNQTAVSLGSTPVMVTFYTENSLPLAYCGASITKFVEGIGSPPGSNLSLILYADSEFTSQNATIEVATSVLSLTVA